MSNIIRAVFFDVGSTLIDPYPDIDVAFHRVASERGHQIDLDTITPQLTVVNEFYEAEYLKDGDFWCSPKGSEEIYLEMYRYLSHLVGLGDDSEGIAQAIHANYRQPQFWRIYEDTLPCLRALKEAHLSLAIVSNWSSNLIDLMRGLKLAPYFDEIISSADVGYRKPNPVIFELTCERIGLKPEEVVHVGDRPDADGEGAQSASIHPVILDRWNICNNCGFERVDSLFQLPALISHR